jgi:DNA-directed RNA polymerase subunit E'/Rpb7
MEDQQVPPAVVPATTHGAEAAARARRRPTRTAGLYLQSIVNTRVPLLITEVGKNLASVLHTKLSRSVEGTCIEQGFVKPGSVQILTYSSGRAQAARVLFDVAYQCLLCRPVEGMLIRGCVVRNVTKAGIRATTEESPSPVMVYVSRDHLTSTDDFGSVKEGDTVTVRVVGQRYELRDQQISIIAVLADQGQKSTARLVVAK